MFAVDEGDKKSIGSVKIPLQLLPKVFFEGEV